MNPPKTVDMRTSIFVTSVALLVGVIFYISLTLASRPPGLAESVAKITRQVDEIERLGARFKGFSPYPADAVCETSASSATGAFRQRLQTAASNVGVNLANVAAAPGEPDEASGGLQPIAVRFEASGQYAAVVGLLQTLAKFRPSLFVDSVDLKSETTSVSLQFSGHLFCSTTRL
jgi:hypothetical protein